MKISELIKEKIEFNRKEIVFGNMIFTPNTLGMQVVGVLQELLPQIEAIEKEQEENSIEKLLEEMPAGIELIKAEEVYQASRGYEDIYEYGKTPLEALQKLKEKLNKIQ